MSKLKPDEEAHFEGGMDGIREWLSTNVVYPQEAIELGIEGKVFLRFIVSKRGKIQNLVILRHADPLLEKEALRAMRKMPLWLPARKNGKPIDSEFNLHITFKLE